MENITSGNIKLCPFQQGFPRCKLAACGACIDTSIVVDRKDGTHLITRYRCGLVPDSMLLAISDERVEDAGV